MSRAVMQQALEALVTCCAEEWRTLNNFGMKQVYDEKKVNAAIAALHAALAEPEQEPDGISWLKRDSGYFTAPTPRKPLTDKEIEVAAKSVPAAVYELMYGHEITVEKFRAALAEFARAIERAHGIGEQT